MKKEREDYEKLSNLEEIPESGNMIVGNTLVQYDGREIIDSHPLNGTTTEELVKDARKQADLESNDPVIVDDENIYNEDIIGDTGRFVTSSEAREELDEQEREDMDSLAEYFNSH